MKRLIPVLALFLAMPACDGLPVDPCDLLPPDFPCPTPIPPDPGAAYDCDNPPAVAGKYFRGPGSLANKIIVVMKRKDDLGGTARLFANKGDMQVVAWNAISVLDKAGIKGLRAVEIQFFEGLGQFAATLDMKKDGLQVIAALLGDPRVAYVSHQNTFRTIGDPWNLDHLDQREFPRDEVYAPDGTGVGVHAACIDTGVSDVPDLGGRLDEEQCFTAVTFRGCDDGHGHGTFTCDEIGGEVYGVAKDVIMHSSRVLDENGSGTTEMVLRGIAAVKEWNEASADRWVANMSFGGPPDNALNAGVCAAYEGDSGVVFVAAAGNSDEDASNSSPANILQITTVGASDDNNKGANFSNYGPLIDVWAPGVGVTAYIPCRLTGDGTSTEPQCRETWQGTSMSAPLVAGVAAIYLEHHPEATPDEVHDWIVENSTKGLLSNIRDSANNLLYVNEDGD